MTAASLALASALAAAATAFSPVAQAQTYPSKPVTLMVGFAEGGPNDILGRLIARALTDRLGQPVQVVNKPGASGNLATDAVAKAAPDGHTLLLIGPANAINTSLFANLTFDFRKDIAPVAGITREALVLVVHPSVPATNVAEFIAYAKAQPGKLKMASTGNGSSPHVSGVLFNRMAGLDLEIVHFAGGGPALKNIIAGETQMMFEPMSASIEPVKAGQLRALAVTTAARAPALPQTPPVGETVPGYEASAVTGIGAPGGTPQAIIDRLNREMNAALADPRVAGELAATGGTPLPGTPADFRVLIEGEIEKWSSVVKAAGISAK
ncbi:MAG: tripartite tricarboxylate transporter substrate binding protein [Beijerinckiaceae bacterium]|nr:tripartite tricarboxylate transporter substrate binding protein [Beijerinckiaceae bacterium]